MSGTDGGTGGPAGPEVNPWQSARRTLLVVLLGWAAAAVVAGVSYLAVGTIAVPIAVGVPLCVVFMVALRLLHRAWWISLLSIGPAGLVLLGAVGYAPAAALELRGVRESVVIVADSAAGTSSSTHRFTLRGADGELTERLVYRGSTPGYRVGDRIEVIRDPEGTVPMDEAEDVDAQGRLDWLRNGVIVWTGMALLAGRRGHVRRKRGRGQDGSLLDGLAHF
ncbi:hypothetical protein [Streptomyces sp. CAU 1734]|uniref:hypothetical protein n=1 Tax=Streptomyces sp. CAU 1734 TaxID=3140360 RepID=UPI003260ED92